MEWSELPGLFPMFPEPERWLPLLQRHWAMLEEAQDRVRVTAITAEDSVGRHYAEALETLRVAGELRGLHSFKSVIDLGTGGGYPGIPIACILPGTRVHLVEPLQKRADLLYEMAVELGLGEVIVHAERGEKAGHSPLRAMGDFVTARAVAQLPELLEYIAPLTAIGGLILLPKGSRLDDELRDAENAMKTFGCQVIDVIPMRPEISTLTKLLAMEKVSSTPGKYPRRTGLPGKRPVL